MIRSKRTNLSSLTLNSKTLIMNKVLYYLLSES